MDVTKVVIANEGLWKLNNKFIPQPIVVKMRPRTQALTVFCGKDGSSVDGTAALTSGYGESSSTCTAAYSSSMISLIKWDVTGSNSWDFEQTISRS